MAFGIRPLPPSEPRASAAEVERVAGGLARSGEPLPRLSEFFPIVYRYVRRRLGDSAEAEEATQEIFETLLLALPRLERTSNLLASAFQIARRQVNWRLGLRRWRARNRDDGEDSPTRT